MSFDLPNTGVHDVQEYEILTYDSLILRCADVVTRTGVAGLVLQLYAIIDRLKKEAIENERRVVDLENDAREPLASKSTSGRQMESYEYGMSDGTGVGTLSVDRSSGIIDAPSLASTEEDYSLHLQTSDVSRCNAVITTDSTLLNIFQVSDDWLQYFSTWLDMRSMGYLDIAVGHRQDRSIWLKCLRTMDAAAVDKHEHSCSSLRWVLERGMRVKSIKIRETGRKDIVAEMFEGFCVPSLLCIDVSECDNVTDAWMISLSFACCQLQEIAMRECTEITDAGVLALAERCPDLRIVDLFTCSNITDASVSALARGCPLLSRVILSKCSNITDGSVSGLAQRCPLLSVISLYHCSNITDASVLAQLSSINLTECSNVTDASVFALAHCCPQLNRVILDECLSITDASISALAQGCPQLSIISLFCCPNITDASILSLAHGCPLLSTIYLKGCSSITDASVLALARGCPLLHNVFLHNCRHITHASISALIEKCPLFSFECFFRSWNDVNYIGG